MYKNVIEPGKTISLVLKDIYIGGQIQYIMCTGPSFIINEHTLIYRLFRSK